jgi:hypothetical protein
MDWPMADLARRRWSLQVFRGALLLANSWYLPNDLKQSFVFTNISIVKRY